MLSTSFISSLRLYRASPSFINEIAARRSSSMMKLAATWSAARLVAKPEDGDHIASQQSFKNGPDIASQQTAEERPRMD
jgi:hypothetical protein